MRYLAGDFSIEEEIELAKICYDEVKTGLDFEVYLENLFTKLGYFVTRTKSTCDQGADLIINNEDEIVVAQAKFYTGKVGNGAIQEVNAAVKYYSADRGMVVTNSTFTKAAIDLADSNNIELVDFSKLEELKEKYKSIVRNRFYKNT